MKQINQALQQKLAEFKAKSGMNQTQLARGIGTSPASISMYLNGTYAEKGGNYETIEPKIEAFLEVQDSKAQREELVLGFVSTKTTRRIAEVMRDAHEGGETVVIYGQAGLGNTSIKSGFCVKRLPIPPTVPTSKNTLPNMGFTEKLPPLRAVRCVFAARSVLAVLAWSTPREPSSLTCRHAPACQLRHRRRYGRNQS